MEDSGEFTHRSGGLDTGEFELLEDRNKKVEKYAKEKAAKEVTRAKTHILNFPNRSRTEMRKCAKKCSRELVKRFRSI